MTMSFERLATRRNAMVFGASTVTAGLLMLYPTSTNHGGTTRKPGTPVAPAGVVTPAPSAKAQAAVVVNGKAFDTRYGPVQVQLVIKSGRIVKAIAIDYPQTNGRDQQINSYAIPALQKETVAAQSAHIDTISGATYTTDGYVQSLQSALDAAHL